MRRSKITTPGFLLLIILMSLNSFGQIVSQTSDGAWLQFRHDSRNTGNSQAQAITTANVSTLIQKTWSTHFRTLREEMATTPVVYGGIVYSVDAYYLYATHTANGASVPGFPFPYSPPDDQEPGCPSSPAIAPQFLAPPIIFLWDGCHARLFAVNSSNGKLLWSKIVYPSVHPVSPDGEASGGQSAVTPVNNRFETSPTVGYGGFGQVQGVFLAQDYVWAFDMAGNPLSGWPSGGQSPVLVGGGFSSPAVGQLGGGIFSLPDTLYVGSAAGGGLYAINLNDGTLRAGWPTSSGTSLYSSPAAPVAPDPHCTWFCPLLTQFVVVGTDANQIEAVDPKSGVPKWTYSDGSSSYESSPAVGTGGSQQLVFVGSHGTSSGDLTALDASNGNPIWRSVALDPIGYSSPAVVNGVVFVATLGGIHSGGNPTLYAFDASGAGCLLANSLTCQPLWSYDLGPDEFETGNGVGSPAVADGMVFEVRGRRLYAFCLSGTTACP